MLKFLIPLLAAFALPTAANAASVYLLVKTTTGNRHIPNGQSWVVPMKTMAGCEEAGLKIISSERFKDRMTKSMAYECLESK